MDSRDARWRLAWLFTFAVGVAGAAACGSDAVGSDACRQIETIRCERANACGIALTSPPSATSDLVEGCKRYYNDACRRGIVGKREPDVNELAACAKTVREGDCAFVKAPETSPSCSFLLPDGDAAAAVDSGSADAAPQDSASDANGIRP